MSRKPEEVMVPRRDRQRRLGPADALLVRVSGRPEAAAASQAPALDSAWPRRRRDRLANHRPDSILERKVVVRPGRVIHLSEARADVEGCQVPRPPDDLA